MTKKAILFLGPSELAGTVREYPDLLFSCDLIGLTPDVYEHSKKAVQAELKYPEWVQAIRTFSIEDYRRIESTLIELELASSKARELFFETSPSRVDWNYQSNYFLLTLMLSVKSFAKQAQANLTCYKNVFIASLNHSGEFYFDSGLHSSLLCHELKKYGVNANLLVLDERSKAFTYQSNLYEKMPNLLSDSFVSNWKKQRSKVLIATAAIYSKSDQLKLGHVLQHSHSQAYRHVYPTPLWPVIKPSSDFEEMITVAEVLAKMPLLVKERCIAYVEWLSEWTSKAFLKCLNDPEVASNEMFIQQMLRLRKRHLLQTLTFCNVYSLSALMKPEMLAITVQDSGLNGPLASAVSLCGVPVYQFPHSHVINWRTPCDCKIVTEWWQPQPPRTLWGDSVPVVYIDSRGKEDSYSIKNKKNKWIFLYNGVQENLCNSVAWPFIKNVVDIVKEKSKEIDCQLVHRLKPGDQTPIATFCEILDLDQDSVAFGLAQPLNELLTEAELVISVDEPSSALWEALEQRCGVVLVADRELTVESLCDGDVLSPFGINQFQKFLTEVVSDKTKLASYIEIQQLKLKEKKLST